MFKLGVFLALLALSAAAPQPAPAPAPAPAPGPSPLTYLASTYAAAYPLASSSQSIVRNYNTFAGAPLATYAAPAYYAYPSQAAYII